MADQKKNPLVPCPAGCGTWVAESKKGEKHSYPEKAGSDKWITCPGG